jgi:hypothetical protein
MKAVTITKDNQSAIGNQYHVDPADLADLLPIGYILIADFAGEWYEGVVTQATFDTFYTKGMTLHNGYYAVLPK